MLPHLPESWKEFGLEPYFMGEINIHSHRSFLKRVFLKYYDSDKMEIESAMLHLGLKESEWKRWLRDQERNSQRAHLISIVRGRQQEGKMPL